MTYTPFNDDDDTYRPELPDPLERTPLYAPTPGYLHREWTPSVICPSPGAEELVHEHSPSLHSHPSEQLSFHPAVEGEDGGAWDEQASDSVNYQIEWRVKLNNRVVVKDTEQELTLPPSSYWEQIKEDPEGILRQKIARSRRVRLDDTTLVLSVNDRTQRDLTKRFDGTGIDWTAVEKQLLAWGHLYRLGKKLRLQISINYMEDSGLLPSRTDKRGKSSVTKRMLADRDAQMTPSRSPVNIRSGGMYIVLCDVPGLHAATKDNIAGKTQRAKDTTD